MIIAQIRLGRSIAFISTRNNIFQRSSTQNKAENASFQMSYYASSIVEREESTIGLKKSSILKSSFFGYVNRNKYNFFFITAENNIH